MNEIYLSLADAFNKLADGYRALAQTESMQTVHTVEQSITKQEESIDIETVRAVLAEKSRDGKTKDIKALLMKYDAGKLSGVKPEDYLNLLKDAEAL